MLQRILSFWLKKMNFRRIKKNAKQMKNEKTRDKQKIIVEIDKERNATIELNAIDENRT